jgi:hypothetical protein
VDSLAEGILARSEHTTPGGAKRSRAKESADVRTAPEGRDSRLRPQRRRASESARCVQDNESASCVTDNETHRSFFSTISSDVTGRADLRMRVRNRISNRLLNSPLRATLFGVACPRLLKSTANKYIGKGAPS